MATVNKDFKIKSGLIVEGTTATVNGFDVLTKKQADQDYVVGLIGGTATSANEANKVVKRDANGNFAAGTITADITGTVSSLSNHDTDRLQEGQGNLYFTNQRALDATAAAYDAAGSAADAATDAANALAQHKANTAAHGVTGAVVGTESTQTLTNKTIGDTLNFTGAGAMTINSDSHIVLTPAAGSSVKWGTDVLATENYVDAAETAANGYTDSAISTEVTNRDSAIATAKAQAIADSEAYTDAEVAALVDTAPALLDTLNELAAAIANNPSYATDAANAVAGRVAKSGDTMTGDLVLPGAPTLNLHAATKGYVDGEVSSAASAAESYTDGEITTALSTAQGYADTAEADAKAYTDDEITDALVTAQGYASTAQGNAQTHTTNAINALDTDDIEEGPTNQYFLDSRAKSSAADLLTGATKTNITITGSGSGLVITAENGVADSNTDQLAEGPNNLYFTPNRAVDALQGVTPNFMAVDLNSVAKQVASTLEAPTAGIQLAYSWLKADYRSAEFLVKVAYGTHTEISKVLLTLDTSDNIAITEYGIVGTNGSASSISAAISNSGRALELQVTTANNNSTVTVVGTLLK
jgi:hypothetical protein